MQTKTPMSFALRPRSSALFIDLAPLVDMVFLLLIFFMIGSRFLRPVLDIDLPAARSQAQADRAAIVLSIDRQRNIFLEGKASALTGLAENIRKLMDLREQNSIILQADRHTPFHLFIKVMEQIRQGGATTLNIESKPAKAME